MKLSNKFFAAAIFFALQFCAQNTFLFAQTQGTFGNNLTWKFSPDGTLRISGNGPAPNSNSVSDPPWNVIKDSITKVVIEEGITTVGDYMFTSRTGHRSINSVTIANSVTQIGRYAFAGCSSMASVTIGSGVTEIGIFAFSESGLTEIVIPGNVTTIGNGVFSKCTRLSSASIGRGITVIPNAAFAESGLTSITIPEWVTNVVDLAFSRCTRLTTVYWNAENVPDYSLIMRPFPNCEALRTVIFGDSVMKIPMHIFTSQTSLTSVTIGSSVAEIGRYAFSGCVNIREIVIPDSVQTIRTNAFDGCRGITSIKLGKGLSRIETQAFQGTSISELTIPEGVATIIGGGAFRNSPRLGTVYFNAVNCADVTGSDNIFADCPLLETIVFGDTVRRIPGYMFQSLRGLISLTIGSRVNEIGRYAFAGCTNLEEIINRAGRPQSLHFTVFENVDKSFCTLRVPSASLGAYRGAEVWKDFQIEGQ